MVNGISSKGQAAISRIADNAKAAGITPDQLQKLLSGVNFDTGLFGKMAPAQVKEAFAGAAESLAKSLNPGASAKVEAKHPEMVRADVLDAVTTSGPALALIDTIFKGKDIAGLPDAAYTEVRAMSGPAVNFELVCQMVPINLTVAETKAFVLGLFDKSIEAAKTGTLPIDREQMVNSMMGLAKGLQQRGLSSTDIKDIVASATKLGEAMRAPDLREPNGKMSLLSESANRRLDLLTYNLAWESKS